jgi:hypothetical protein
MRIKRENRMKLARRAFLHLAADAAGATALPRGATAVDYPTRPVRITANWRPS